MVFDKAFAEEKLHWINHREKEFDYRSFLSYL